MAQIDKLSRHDIKTLRKLYLLNNIQAFSEYFFICESFCYCVLKQN